MTTNSSTPRRNLLGPDVLLAAKKLTLTDEELAKTLHYKEADIPTLRETPHLAPAFWEGQRALELMRLAQRLGATFNHDPFWMELFMRHRNAATGGIPVEQIQTLEGLLKISDYLRIR